MKLLIIPFLTLVFSMACGPIDPEFHGSLHDGDGLDTGAVCIYDGYEYTHGQSFASNDGCNDCGCGISGDVFCTQKFCGDLEALPVAKDLESNKIAGKNDADKVKEEERDKPKLSCSYDGKKRAPGEIFPSKDNCNKCSCSEDGKIRCTLKSCVPKDENPPEEKPKGCFYDGNKYKPGQSFPSTDGCNKCVCTQSGAVACTKKACYTPPTEDPKPKGCFYNGKQWDVGEGFQSKDGCNKCGCAKDGTIRCTQKSCAKPKGCFYDGQHRNAGDVFRSTDGCNRCGCAKDGSIYCTKRACKPKTKPKSCQHNGKNYKNGENFSSADGCASCGCLNGVVVCQQIACHKR